MSVVSFALAVVFIIRLFSTSAFRVPKPGCFFNEIFRCGAQLKIDRKNLFKTWHVLWYINVSPNTFLKQIL